MAREEAKKKNAFKDEQRGTQDELEIMRLIILQTPGLKQSVLEKLRQAKARMGIAPTSDKKPEPKSADGK